MASIRRRHYDWEALVERLQQQPGRWFLEFPNDKVRLAKRIRLRQHPALRRDDGAVEVQVLHTHRNDDGSRRGDIWLRWVANQHPNEGGTP